MGGEHPPLIKWGSFVNNDPSAYPTKRYSRQKLGGKFNQEKVGPQLEFGGSMGYLMVTHSITKAGNCLPQNGVWKFPELPKEHGREQQG